ncbi:MAG TPA: family 78 glycoside hydrolase catalytic domain, partial [Chryseolinea sp.]|nr:family 78 glycoside hydrolase catalytic domain [Chryseolinea sp.]
FFETAMMSMSDWQGSWVTDSNDIHLKPAPYFRKTFVLSKRVKSARLYIATAGLSEVFSNGQRIGDHRLDPTYTRFDKRNLYVTHNITSLLKDSLNVIGVLLGNGWYNHQSTAVWDFHKAKWRSRPRFRLNLRIVYEDNSVETVVSDETWKTSLSPIIFNSIYTAEHHDARLEQNGWNTSTFDDNSWRDAIKVSEPSSRLVAQVLHPIRNVEEVKTRTFRKVSSQKYIYDLGRNISGVTKLTAKGAKGTTLRVTHAEQLDSVGNIDLSNIDVHYRPTDDSDPFQTDIYILAGDGEETFMPYFNYKGFQFIEVTSDRPVELSAESLSGYFMHSDVPKAGSITSSNETVNKIWEATNNSYLSNLFGYPTDCPQREKNGWTGDAHIAIETGLYNFDGITVYEKWMADHRDEQKPDGVLPSIIPTSGWGYEWGNGPDWTSTIAIIPWNIYLFYGDPKLLQECYENIKRYVDHIDSMSPSGLTDWGLGDWVPVKSVTPKEMTSSIYYYVDATILSKAAKLLNKNDDAAKYSALSKKIADAINTKYLNKEKGIYGSGLQTELSAPLYWGIVPEDVKEKVVKNLVSRVNADNDHIDVGLLGTKTILNALSENGHADLAFKVASQETFPSWGYWIKNGATTLFENWPIAAKSDISRNHIMFGEIGAWMYKALGGIKPDPEHQGLSNVIIQPNFVQGLNSFRATHDGPYGEIISEWKRQNNKIQLNVTIPPNSTATLYLSGTKVIDKKTDAMLDSQEDEKKASQFIVLLSSGAHEFEIEQ